jgi:AP-3 complex subunit sigma
LEKTQAQEQEAVRFVYSMVNRRSDSCCNFIEISGRLSELFPAESRLIYRHYATLYFVFLADQAESELGILDLIQVFVEVLDRRFENVCELDLIFYPTQVQLILDELMVAGLVVETNMKEILKSCKDMDEYEAASSKLKSLTTAETKKLSGVKRN